MNLKEIDSLTLKLAEARQDLAGMILSMKTAMAAVEERFIPLIRKKVSMAAERHANLNAAIDVSRELFDKPRTLVLHGIRIGLRKGSGGIDWADDAAVVARIRKHFSKVQANLLIKITEKPIAKALQDLDVSDLKAIGCTVEDTGDIVVIKPTDTEVEKFVSALLKDATDEAQKEAA